MEFYELDYNTAQTFEGFGNGVKITLLSVMFFWILSNAFEWCVDPLADKLRARIKDLEDENDELIDQIEDLKNELEFTLENVRNRRNQ